MSPVVTLLTATVVLLYTWAEHTVGGNSIAARNVRFRTLNLNLSIAWSAPPSENLDEVITYTVVEEKISEDVVVPHCENITRTSCYLVPFFPSGEFGMYEYFYVKSRSSLKPNEEVESFTRRFDRRIVDVSSPVIYNATVTRRKVIVRIHGPETPFSRDGFPLYMGDPEVGGRWFMLDSVRYNATLFQVDDPDDTGRTSEEKILENGLGRIYFGNLHPFTRYRLLIQSRLNRRYSQDVTVYEFCTNGDAPDVGPVISGHRITRRYCDYRDIEITWKEMKIQRSNGPLTEYVIEYVSEETNETGSVAVSSTNVSATLPRLIRWETYDVMVSSVNQFGSTKGQRVTIEPDIPLIETYKPKINGIVKVSQREWQVSWDPPEQHNQCIVGYMITTHIEGAIEEEIIVYGFNTSSALLHFGKIGRYQVDLRPLVNDSAETTVFATTMYNAKTMKIREWSILAGVLSLLLILSAAVVFMVRKVLCDTSALPDINKSKSMKLVKSATSNETLLRKPPEKECFDKTRMSATIINAPLDFNDEGDDDVFQPKSNSTSLLLSSSSDDCRSLRKRGTANINIQMQHTMPTVDQIETSQLSSFKGGDPEQILSGNEETGPRENTNQSQHDHGYVKHAHRYKCTLSVKIPLQRKPHLISSPSSSSDSGISASTYLGSVSDYAPSPSPSGMDNSLGNTPSFEYDFKVDPPYVTTQVAVHSGRLKSTSVSSDVSSDSPVYNRIDSRLSFFDPYPKGYLTMEPAKGHTSKTSEKNNESTETSSTAVLSPYSKLSPKK